LSIPRASGGEGVDGVGFPDHQNKRSIRMEITPKAMAMSEGFCVSPTFSIVEITKIGAMN
jgi:hypothetical protein